MEKVLLVEDSRTFASVIKKNIESELHFPVDWVTKYSEAVDLLDKHSSDYFVALLDLHLPDAAKGEILDFVLSKKIPPIVLTGRFGDEIREYIWAKRVVDYVLKESPRSVDYVMSLVRRIYRNKSINVLVVEDSVFSRKHLSRLLQVHQYQVFGASDGKQALEVLSGNGDIKLVIIDHFLPDMDGIELTQKIRRTCPKDTLAIIGISAQGNNVMSARFMKNGGNDFINKPFINEEFYCRVSQNIEMLEFMERVKQASHIDYLTDLYNRRYLFESGQLLYANAIRKYLSLVVAMIDIDHFKLVNDTHGHKAGDAVLQQLGWLLKKRFRKSDIVARFGGEEFCILATNMEEDLICKIFDDVRAIIEQMEFVVDSKTLHVTVSIGVCSKLKPSLEEMINTADTMLYESKNRGRNRIVCE